MKLVLCNVNKVKRTRLPEHINYMIGSMCMEVCCNKRKIKLITIKFSVLITRLSLVVMEAGVACKFKMGDVSLDRKILLACIYIYTHTYAIKYDRYVVVRHVIRGSNLTKADRASTFTNIGLIPLSNGLELYT